MIADFAQFSGHVDERAEPNVIKDPGGPKCDAFIHDFAP